jgi:hypothetical protein
MKDRSCEELEQLFYTSLNKIRKFLLDVNARIVKEGILKQTIWNTILHQINNNNEVRIVKCSTSKNITVKNKIFPHRNTHIFTWTLSDGKTQKQFDHISVDRRRPSNVLKILSFRATD